MLLNWMGRRVADDARTPSPVTCHSQRPATPDSARPPGCASVVPVTIAPRGDRSPYSESTLPGLRPVVKIARAPPPPPCPGLPCRCTRAGGPNFVLHHIYPPYRTVPYCPILYFYTLR